MTVSETGRHGSGGPRVLGDEAVIRVLTVSDWHIGSGAGAPGGIDAVIRRDADGLPYIPGTTLTGVLRDSCEQIALALDGGMSPGENMATLSRRPWFRWVTYLFGARVGHGSGPQGAVVSIRPALASERVRQAVAAAGDPAGAEAFRSATTFVKPGVKVTEATGRAQDGMLRMVEMARAGLVLHAAVSVDGLGALTEEQHRAATVLLVLGTAWLRRLGADRHRGSGEINARLQTAEDEDQHSAQWQAWVTDCLEWAEKTEPIPPPEAAPTRTSALRLTSSTVDPVSRCDGEPWVTVPLTITTVDPIRVPRNTFGNLITGRDYIPGTNLLPWLLSRAKQVTALRRALVTSEAVITDATPDVEGRRGRRAPMALQESKRSGDEELVNAVTSGQRYKPLRTGWLTGEVSLDSAGIGHVGIRDVVPTVVTHNVATPLAGRPTTVDGGVYTVEAIPPRTVLRAELRMREALADEMVRSLPGQSWAALAGTARIGSRTASEYGRVAVEVGNQGLVTCQRGLVTNEEFIVWALADVLVRDDWLRLSGDPNDVVTELEQQLRDVSGSAVRLEILARHTQATRTESWQRSWGLPRPTLVGLAAGSCLTVKLTAGTVSAEQVAVVCARGIGERRGEGYGQIDVSHLDSAGVLGWTGPLRRRAVKPGADLTAGDPAGYRVPADPADEQYLERVRLAALSRVLAELIRRPAGPTDTDAVAAERENLKAALQKESATRRGQLRAVVAALRSDAGAAPLDTYLSKHPGQLAEVLTRLRSETLPPLVTRAHARLAMAEPVEDAVLQALGVLVLTVLSEIDAEPVADETRQLTPGRDKRSAASAARASAPRPADRQPRQQKAGSRGSSSARPRERTGQVEFRPVHTRYELTLTLVARTPLHVGGSHGDPHVDLTVAVNGRGEPYVPGSSLAGALRSRWSRLFGVQRTRDVWDGTVRVAKWDADKPEEFLASLVEVADTTLVAADGASSLRLEVRDGVGIDRWTGSAAHRIKYDREVVPAGTTLEMRLIAEDCEPAESGRSRLYDEITRLATELADHGIAVGAATSRGLGRLTVKPGTTVTVTRHEVGSPAGILDAIRHAVELERPQQPMWQREMPADAQDASTPPAGVLRVEIDWCPDGPLLVGAALPADNAALVPLLSAHPDTGTPVPVLPGSSVKGVVRAEAERTLRTVFREDVPTGRQSFVHSLATMAATFPPLGALFGSQDQRGALSVPDTYATVPDDTATWTDWDAYLSGSQQTPPAPWAREVTRTAIDRWTGGAADRLLYTTLEPHGLAWQPLRFDIDLVRLLAMLTPHDEDSSDVTAEAQEFAQRRAVAALALFLYCVASFVDGRLPLGRGGNRGLGQVRIRAIAVALGEQAGETMRLPDMLRTWRCAVPMPPLVNTGEPKDRRSEVLALARALCEHSGILGTWTEYLIHHEPRVARHTDQERGQ